MPTNVPPGAAPAPQEPSEAQRMATDLLNALTGIYPHAAAEEFKQLGPQVLRDLLVEVAQLTADLTAVCAQHNETIDDLIQMRCRAEQAEAALTALRAERDVFYMDYLKNCQEAFETIRDFGDIEMQDGDAARRVAREMLTALSAAIPESSYTEPSR